ncbi:tumor necrosis factor alpha-induced protein 3-like isoform X2 [Conger conger]|uniref:tumor necrosis factor alpha-induced protein 3-like isoform X2 n=1 Tax=Conger conger TaxID=82655 RepID=UPI002A5A81F9|nr:tumor necrosis factor alpha-induced protein 3-like isoform X2 [Conger conger]
MSQGQSFLPKFLFLSNLLKAGFREVVQTAILDRAMQGFLEQEKRLNWCREVKKLVPLCTKGDGNCLLHATSQYMLGVEDTDLVLRKALYSVLTETDTHKFRMRFQAELSQSQEFMQTGLRYNTRNWQEEWEKIVEMASLESNCGGLQYDSLEDIHIFILSNILRRPIVVIADQVLRSMKSGSSFSPLNVGGVYLPLHWAPRDCYRYPIVLGYNSQHFAPLIAIKDSGPEIRAVPLAYPGKGVFEDLQVHFLMEKEQQQKAKLLKDYLTVIEIPVNALSNDAPHIINAARLDEGNLPEDMNLMEDYLQLVNHEFKLWQKEKEPASEVLHQDPLCFSQLSLMEVRCATHKCPFYASVDTQPYCHECCERHRERGRPVVEPSGDQARPGAEPRGGIGSVDQVPLPTSPSFGLYSETNAMKCKMPDCLFTLNIEHGGLCERCFHARQTSRHREWSNTGERSSALREAGRCDQRTVNIGGEQQQQSSWGLISRTQLNSSSPGASPEPGPYRHLQLGRLCKRTGCQYFGTVEKEGFCTVCFTNYKTNRRAVVVRRGSPPAGSGFLGSSHSTRAAQQGQTPNGPQYSRSNASTGWTGLYSECHTQIPEETPKLRCKAPDCDHYANKEKQGYCNSCDHFKQRYS